MFLAKLAKDYFREMLGEFSDNFRKKMKINGKAKETDFGQIS